MGHRTPLLKRSRNYKRSACPQTSNNILQYSPNRAHHKFTGSARHSACLIFWFMKKNRFVNTEVFMVCACSACTNSSDCCVCDKNTATSGLWTKSNPCPYCQSIRHFSQGFYFLADHVRGSISEMRHAFPCFKVISRE